MDVGHGFTILRELGRAGHGGFLPFDALVAIHMAHRLFALVATAALLWLMAGLWRDASVAARRYALALLGLLVLQVATGLSNVVLDWPLVAALAHTAAANDEYNKAIFPYLLKHLSTCRPKEVPQHAERTLPAVNESNKDDFIKVLRKRNDDLSGAAFTRLGRIIRLAEKI